jgi:hypothetical protein
MPRRLDPRNGLPGLFAPGRPKAADMAFLVEAPAASAVESPPAARKRPPRKAKAAPLPAAPEDVLAAPAVAPASPAPLPDHLRLAPAFRSVPLAPPSPEPLRLAEVPGLLACAASWLASAFGAAGTR